MIKLFYRNYFSLFLLFGATLSAQSVKGLYVDGFINIIGNTQSEDSLLNYAQANGFNYLALYDLQLVHAQYNMTNFSSIAPLASFINRAKSQFGILKVGAIAENFWFFQNRIRPNNIAHTNPLEKFDVYDLEFEFWNTTATGPSGYYCTTYLQPASLPCDTAGAFSFYKNELRKIDSVATIDNVISETYVGWPTSGQAHQLAGLCDRVLVHAYVNTAANAYGYTQTRLSYFASSPSAPVNIIVIFSSEPSFMGPWLSSNSETLAFSTYNTAFQNDPSAWTSGINLLGYQWFDYSNMIYTLPMTIVANEDGNGLQYFQNGNQLDFLLLSPKENVATIFIYNSCGQLVNKNSEQVIKGENKISINTENFSDGIYFFSVQFPDLKPINGKFVFAK